ncbi:MAG: pirin family protein [Gemmataceae bacterium]
MLTLRKGTDRGVTQIDWLDSRHSFSFGEYYDPRHHHYRTLRVINDDRVAAGGGFPPHPHRDMEILTCILSGELEHADSLGTGAVIRAGEWQRMTAGSGVVHSEFNPSKTAESHFLQIWIVPDRKGLPPEYEQKPLPAGLGQWRTIASPDGRDGSLTIHQDALISSARIREGENLNYSIGEGRGVWLHVARGSVNANGHELLAGDALAYDREPQVVLTGRMEGEVVLFDLK